MRKLLTLLFFYFGFYAFSQQVAGRVTNDSGVGLSSVLVVNISNQAKTYTDTNGNFQIPANTGDELRFVRENYYRLSQFIFTNNTSTFLNIELTKIPTEIAEVHIINLSGDLGKDSKMLTKKDKTAELEKEIGVPKPPEKPREKPAELEQILIPILVGQLNVQKVYDLISGKSRRQKNLYKYEDLQDKISWVKQNIEASYFTKLGIPENRISEFLQFSFSQNPIILDYVKAKNASAIALVLEELAPVYLKKSK